jgi:hypothetical protein
LQEFCRGNFFSQIKPPFLLADCPVLTIRTIKILESLLYNSA